MLVDTHCHLDFDWFDEDRDEVVGRARSAGVQRIIVPAVNLENCPEVIRLAEQFEGVYAAVGVHPNSSAGWSESWIVRLREIARHGKVVAIGEIGLDYYRDSSPKSDQKRAFSDQLKLAAELQLPVIIHNRESDDDILRLIAESPLLDQEQIGVLHSFSGSKEMVRQALDYGLYLGFTGPVTYKKADALRNLVAKVPLDRLLVETDAPFLAPHPYRGKRNEPAYVVQVAGQVAQIQTVSPAVVAQRTTENAVRLFGSRLK